ncbi:DUF3592 domain-containing protein [Ruminococcus sp.]|uniref:DUF3592 domain-containing protein n=1 Tax=Ruminococcus sp. TaxID=41978 RepID=UPI0025D16F44|nr:DUF3592 domain-containing protein [Ruminococcus sp.]MBQ8967679.1 DUF3592 domain-containing protein [Ruminococcus sp.]
MARRITRTNPKVILVFGLLMLLAGLFGIGNGIRLNRLRSRCTLSTEADVTSVREERRSRKSGKHSRHYYYVYITGFEYTTDNGEEYSGTDTLKAEYSVGDHLTVHYNPDKPTEYYIAGLNDPVGYTYTGIFMGALGLVIALGGFIDGKKNGFGARTVVNGVRVGSDYNSFNNNYGSCNNGYNSYNSNNNYNNGYGNSYNNNNGYNNGYGNGYAPNNNYNNGYNSNNYNNNYNSCRDDDFNRLN